MENEQLFGAISEIVRLLCEGKYDALAERTNNHRMTSQEIADEVQAYPYKIVFPPEEALRRLVTISSVDPRLGDRYHVRVDLWTKEEGRSDLSALLWVTMNHRNVINVELENIEVL